MVVYYTVQYTPKKTIFGEIESVKMPDIDTAYRSFLLRLWHEAEPGAPWRIMLESVNKPGERHYFKDLESLVAFLVIQQEPASKQADTEGDHVI